MRSGGGVIRAQTVRRPSVAPPRRARSMPPRSAPAPRLGPRAKRAPRQKVAEEAEGGDGVEQRALAHPLGQRRELGLQRRAARWVCVRMFVWRVRGPRSPLCAGGSALPRAPAPAPAPRAQPHLRAALDANHPCCADHKVLLPRVLAAHHRQVIGPEARARRRPACLRMFCACARVGGAIGAAAHRQPAVAASRPSQPCARRRACCSRKT